MSGVSFPIQMRRPLLHAVLFGENHSIPQLSFRSRSASLFLADVRVWRAVPRIFGDASRAPPIRLPVSQGYRDIGVGIAFGLTPSARSVAPPGLAVGIVAPSAYALG